MEEVEEPYVEGVGTHGGPLSCVGSWVFNERAKGIGLIPSMSPWVIATTTA